MKFQAGLAAFAAAVLGSGDGHGQVQFVSDGAARGIAPYVTAFGKGGGVAAADFDDDGDVDLFVPNGIGAPDQLYENDGTGHFTDIAAAAGLDDTRANRVALWFDYDGDRRLDLFVAGDCWNNVDPACADVSTLHLYRQVADSVFQDVTIASGIGDDYVEDAIPHRGGAAAGDLDGDGWLDLVVGMWSAPAPRVYLNNRDGTFSDAAADLGLDVASYYWQPIFHDFDRDGRQDVFYAIDFQRNQFWVHDGMNGLVDAAASCGTDSAWNEMGVAPGDFDNDGRLDLYVTNITQGERHNLLYHNQTVDGVLQFTDVSAQTGTAQGYWGWGCVFFDADNDTRLDLAATNGWFSGTTWPTDPSVFYHNQGGDPVTFVDASDAVGFNDQLWGSSLVATDLDRDGDLDLVQTCNGSGMTAPELRILDNQPAPATAGTSNWLVVKPRMASPNHRAIGAVVRAQVGSTQMMRLITAGTSHCGQEPAEAFFGLGPATTVDQVTVQWPDGSVSTYDDVPANTVLEAGQIAFTDISADAGVGLPGILTESVAWGDYDGDGDEDLYLTNQGANNLFRNDGRDVFTDVTVATGTGSDLWGVGTAFADLDNDDDLDLYVVNFGLGPDHLYRNDGPVGVGGEHVFTDVAMTAGITIERSSRGMAFVDFDRDGLLDIYVNAIGDDILYRNLGGLQFTDVAATVLVTGNPPLGQGVGVVCSDLDNNGHVDIYNGNRSGQLSNVFMNSGGTLTDIAAGAGVNAFGLGMGVHAFDYDNDLDMDLYWTTWPGGGKSAVPNALYRNLGGNLYLEVAGGAGVADPTGWGISNNDGDVDNDRWLDFFVTNGFDEGSGPNRMYRSLGVTGTEGVSFQDISNLLLGLPKGDNYDGRGVAFADFDNDGDQDLILTGDTDDTNRLWRNDTINAHHWVTFKLKGFGPGNLVTGSNRSAVGARIEVSAGGLTTVREVSSGAGRGSFNSLPVEFGLASAATIDSVFIRWPSGRTQTLSGLAADACVDLIEPNPADVDADGEVDVDDLVAIILGWGTDGLQAPGVHADVDNDGEVEVDDLNAVIVNWD